MSKLSKSSAAGSLLTTLCANPEQKTVALSASWGSKTPVIKGEQVDSVLTGTPILKTPKGEDIVHRLAVLTHVNLQQSGRSMCFNEVHAYIQEIAASVSMSGLGMKLHDETLKNVLRAEGEMAESALKVCIESGVYKPVIPTIQTRPSQSGRGPR